MSIAITMPQLGLTMTEGSVAAWTKKPGDPVKKDEILLSVSTDKVDMDVEAPADGTLGAILVDVGTVVPVGTVLAHLLGEGESADPAPSAAQVSSAEAAPPPQETTQPVDATVTASTAAQGTSATNTHPRAGRIIASPRARKMAEALGISLSAVQGSGPSGRIVADDISAAHARGTEKAKADPVTKRRQIIADRMVESVTTIPSFSVSAEIVADHLVVLYENIKGLAQGENGARLTYTDLILKAVSIALVKTPEINATWEQGSVQRASACKVAMAVATESGVIAPVLSDAHTLDLKQVAKMRADLSTRARQNKLDLRELEGAAGTVSNLGMYRVDRFEGLITPGQTFIVSVGRLATRPVVVADALVARPTMHLTLSVDHRVADGAAAALFLERIAEALENPYTLVWTHSRMA